MFSYCGNNPAVFQDPDGLCREIGALLTWVDCGNSSCPTSSSQNPTRYSGGDNIRNVTNEILEPLNKAANRARSVRKIANYLFGDNLASDAFVGVEFYELVDNEQPWDIKRPKPWVDTIRTMHPGEGVIVIFGNTTMTPEDLGNFTYGYLGYAYGFSLDVLLCGSYYVAGFPTGGSALSNEFKDWGHISIGYDLAKSVYGG